MASSDVDCEAAAELATEPIAESGPEPLRTTELELEPCEAARLLVCDDLRRLPASTNETKTITAQAATTRERGILCLCVWCRMSLVRCSASILRA